MSGMYTKMTATGSSVIVAPRTISKELEAKIAASIARVITKHEAAQLTTKLVRQAVERDVHVSLSNHKEVLKRLMHQEFRRVKAEKAAKRADVKPWKWNARYKCMMQGLHRLYAMAGAESSFGPMELYVCRILYDLQAVEQGDLARAARTYMRMLATRWLQRPQRHEWNAEAKPTPEQFAHALEAVYTMERMGLSHDDRPQLQQVLVQSPPVLGVTEIFGWDPTSNPPEASADCSRFKRMTKALTLCWFAHSLQQSLGCSFTQLLQHWPVFYPYKSPSELPPAEYRDQVQMVTTLVLVLSRFGSLRCEPELLLQEYYFLRQHLVYHIVRQDVLLVGGMLRALRCFDGSDNLVAVRRGMALIMLTQSSDGAWNNDEGHPTCNVVANAICALSEPHPCGVAPSIPELVPMLQLHLNADLPFLVAEYESPESEMSKGKDAVSKQESNTSSADKATDPTQDKSSTSSPLENNDKAIGATQVEDLETQVRFLQGMLEKEGSNIKAISATLAIHVLSTLAGMKLTVEILKATGVGRVINKLRKHKSEEVANTATELVAKWKKALL